MEESFLELVKKRRSVRRYQERPIPRESLERCLEAARLAPSACNAQPWRFIVLDQEPLRSQAAKAAFSGMYSLFSFAAKAPVLVVPVRLQSSYVAKLGGLLRRVDYSLIDIGIAGEHFVLQATEEGLGTCWIGWFNHRRLRKLLGLGAGEKIDVLIAVGYPADEPGQKRRKSLEEIREYRE